MLPQPVLELDHTAVENRRCTLCSASHETAFAKELDEPAYPPHVLPGHALLSSNARAPTAMPREPIDDSTIDIGDRDLDQRQPLREMTGCSVIAAHRQARMPQLR